MHSHQMIRHQPHSPLARTHLPSPQEIPHGPGPAYPMARPRISVLGIRVFAFTTHLEPAIASPLRVKHSDRFLPDLSCDLVDLAEKVPDLEWALIAIMSKFLGQLQLPIQEVDLGLQCSRGWGRDRVLLR